MHKAQVDMATVYLGIGSNIGNREENCAEAARRLNSVGELSVEKSSSLYETKPVGGPEQRDFINGVLEVETDIPSGKFLDTIKAVEKTMGREPAGKDHPRIIDIDILLYGSEVVETDELVIPHPRMHTRHFVLKGLAEIAPEVVHPVLQKTVRELQDGLKV